MLNDADLDWLDQLRTTIPEPYQPWIDKLDLKQFYRCPFLKVTSTEDNVLPQGEWGWHPRMSNRKAISVRTNAR